MAIRPSTTAATIASSPPNAISSAGDDDRQAGDQARGVLRELGLREVDLLLDEHPRVASEISKHFAE